MRVEEQEGERAEHQDGEMALPTRDAPSRTEQKRKRKRRQLVDTSESELDSD